jgi:hypothetical protein
MSRHHDSGDHIDAGKTFEHPDYPSCIDFASKPSENRSLITSGAQSRGPGGSMRGKGPWKTHCHAPEVNETIRCENGDLS